MAMSQDERDRRFRHLRQSGLSRPATEAILEEIDDIHKLIEDLKARVGATSSE